MTKTKTAADIEEDFNKGFAKRMFLVVLVIVILLGFGAFLIEKQATKAGLINQEESEPVACAPYPSKITGYYGYVVGEVKIS